MKKYLKMSEVFSHVIYYAHVMALYNGSLHKDDIYPR